MDKNIDKKDTLYNARMELETRKNPLVAHCALCSSFVNVLICLLQDYNNFTRSVSYLLRSVVPYLHKTYVFKIRTQNLFSFVNAKVLIKYK